MKLYKETNGVCKALGETTDNPAWLIDFICLNASMHGWGCEHIGDAVKITYHDGIVSTYSVEP